MIKTIKIITLVVALFGVLLMSGCKDEYFEPGQAIDTSGSLGISTMEYLQRHPENFDTLVRLIKIAGLETAVNSNKNTFLAPRDYSIHNYIKLLYPDPTKIPATLEAFPQAEKDQIAQILKDYIIPNQEILRSNLATTYSYANTLGGKKARFNIVTSDYLGNVNMGAKNVVFSLNVSATGSPERYQTVQVATADLRATNGIVHVLTSDSHIFGFN